MKVHKLFVTILQNRFYLMQRTKHIEKILFFRVNYSYGKSAHIPYTAGQLIVLTANNYKYADSII